MKIAVSGKGGVGKTTLSAMLAAALGLKGQSVIAIDADADANLGAALGLPPDQCPVPLSELRELIAERTGAKPDYGGYFKLNPRVDDLPEQYCQRIGPIQLLTMGGVRRGGDGCICPATALIKALLTHLVLRSQEAIIMDMEAGIEHLGRATARSMDVLLVVVDEGPWSVRTALRVRTLAQDIGLSRVAAVVNRVRPATDLDTIRQSLQGIPLVGTLPYDERLAAPLIQEPLDESLKPADVLNELLPTVQSILESAQ